MNPIETSPLNDKYNISAVFSVKSGIFNEETFNRSLLLSTQSNKVSILNSTFVTLNAMGYTNLQGNFNQVTFLDSDFNCCHFENTFFRKVTLTNCAIRNTEFQSCRFEQSEITLSRPVTHEDCVSFHHCVFVDMDFTHDNANFLNSAQFHNCIFIGGEVPEAIRKQETNHFIREIEEEPIALMRDAQAVPKTSPPILPPNVETPENKPPSNKSTSDDTVDSLNRFDTLEL